MPINDFNMDAEIRAPLKDFAIYEIVGKPC